MSLVIMQLSVMGTTS